MIVQLLDDIANWMDEIADWFEKIASASQWGCTYELNQKRALLWRERATKARALSHNRPVCNTCTYYIRAREDETAEIVHSDGCAHELLLKLKGQGPNFCCSLHNYEPGGDTNV